MHLAVDHPDREQEGRQGEGQPQPAGAEPGPDRRHDGGGHVGGRERRPVGTPLRQGAVHQPGRPVVHERPGRARELVVGARHREEQEDHVADEEGRHDHRHDALPGCGAAGPQEPDQGERDDDVVAEVGGVEQGRPEGAGRRLPPDPAHLGAEQRLLPRPHQGIPGPELEPVQQVQGAVQRRQEHDRVDLPDQPAPAALARIPEQVDEDGGEGVGRQDPARPRAHLEPHQGDDRDHRQVPEQHPVHRPERQEPGGVRASHGPGTTRRWPGPPPPGRAPRASRGRARSRPGGRSRPAAGTRSPCPG